MQQYFVTNNNHCFIISLIREYSNVWDCKYHAAFLLNIAPVCLVFLCNLVYLLCCLREKVDHQFVFVFVFVTITVKGDAVHLQCEEEGG